jgi:glycerol-3-phosphate dehydrogenase
MIVRNLPAATQRQFDVVVIGGGIYGVSLLQEAARRGLSACLCEAADFGGGTSWNTLRIVHGGLRYLQTMDLGRFLQSVAARRRVVRQFPTLLRPLQCLMPLYGRGMKRMAVMRMALLANDLLSARRNVGVLPAAQLPASGVLDARATRGRFPRVRADGLQGAACWNDYFMISSERILIELLHDACRHGAIALNYTPVAEIETEGKIARGVRVRDALSGEAHTIAARAVVNCAGPQVRTLARGRGGNADQLFQPSLAFNVLLDIGLPGASALAIAPPQPGAPIFFIVPQQGTLLAGTMHLPRSPDTKEAVATESELERFLALLNEAVPGLGAGRQNVRRVFAGLLPAVRAGSCNLAKRVLLRDHGRAGGLERFYSVSGVKFTTANDVAGRALAMIGGGELATNETYPLPISTATSMLTNAADLWSHDDESVAAVLRQVVQEEAVQSLEDLVLRRTNWATTETDLDRVRDRVTQLVRLPAVASPHAAPPGGVLALAADVDERSSDGH